MAHTHVTPAAASRNRLRIVFGITLAVFAFELVGGIAANSLALIADAGHLLTDVAGIGLTLVAIWFAGRPANRNRSYGLMRLEILAAVVNAMLLFAVAAYVLVEAWRRWNAPPEVDSEVMLLVAVVGLVANGISLMVLRDAQRESLPMRGAYLEVMGDLFGSVAVIIAALVIAATGQVRADAIASVLIGLLILPRTWTLLKDAVDVLLEASPKGIDLGDVRTHILEAPGV
ncbi:MAG TPA: cation diffusion facilitator family transporter, partial [Candidatus Limnocylindrales bacterium]